ncbi:divalent-cation tolerance protein CutA [Polynucleobacter sp. AP-Nino-20-G2]|uniref:divalent-cation tolerance protein CutA n=1 Tax=Polynucleobacter sp. AP-Nino-20-G2 TaxID=2576917 RepID=UPI001BFEA305|nr:divalent-cation tolerance protein CutA [Polynucleobacter sp. AP-Nino-20-G2]QWE16737.1 divalent-cation tolerance protein CutA [Polynucleobacter sp. AP-Nino-20-G2]
MTSIQSSPVLVVVSSFSKLADAQAMARSLIENRLAACVQIQEGMHSIYRWEGEICEEREVVLSAKTIAAQWDEISNFIKNNHPYDLPEVLAFTPEKYEAQYGDWVRAEVKSGL